MAFDGFYIKLSSIAKLPHTDTYYACFEYKNKYKTNSISQTHLQAHVLLISIIVFLQAKQKHLSN